MSIATEISRIQTAKADIKSAIEAKGVTIPSSATIDTYDDYVSQISGGGGSSADTAALKGLIERSATSIDIPSGTTSIGDNAFYNCTNLSSVTIPSSVTSIGENAFKDCSGLTSVNIPNSVTSIGNKAFENCSGLTSCIIGSGVTIIGNNAFIRCTSLTSVTIPSGVTTIGTQAFNTCSGLTSITIEATTPPSLGTNPFNNTNNCPIYVPAESVSSYQTAWSSTYASRIQAIQ